MKNAAKYIIAGFAMTAAGIAPALAADVFEPTVIEAPIFEAPEALPAKVGGWYLRADLGYAINSFGGADYYTFCGAACGGIVAGANSLSGDLDNSLLYGGGIGYQANHYLRGDLTVDYFETDFLGTTVGSCGVSTNCFSTDIATVSAIALMANAYVDLGTYGRFTPYVGAGIGGAHVEWGNLSNTACDTANPALCDPTVTHTGFDDWRFTWALMAGVSVDVTCALAADVGYRFRSIDSGAMFGYAASTGPGFDRGIQSHEVRAGVRYKLGGCAQPVQQVVYQPGPLPVYK